MTPTTDADLKIKNAASIKLPSELPSPVASWLVQTTSALMDAFAADLCAVILFGSAAEGRMRASSDVNLLIVLNRLNSQALNQVSELFRSAAAAIELHPMFVLSSELPLALDVFAVKFDDIAHRHFVMYGDDPFINTVISRAQLLGRVQQTLLNLTLRLRANYVINGDRDEVLAMAIADSAAPLRRSAHAILELRGTPGASPKESLEVLAAELGGEWTDDLRSLSQARAELHLRAGTARPLVLRLAELSEALQQSAARSQP